MSRSRSFAAAWSILSGVARSLGRTCDRPLAIGRRSRVRGEEAAVPPATATRRTVSSPLLAVRVLPGRGEDLAQGGPEAEGAVAHRQLRRDGQSLLPEADRQLVPALFAFAVTILDGQQLLAPLRAVSSSPTGYALLLAGVLADDRHPESLVVGELVLRVANAYADLIE